MECNKPKQLFGAWAYIMNNKCKVQRVRKEICKHKITLRHIIEEKTNVLIEKPLCGPPSWNDPLMNKVGIEEYQRKPSKPNLFTVLESSEF